MRRISPPRAATIMSPNRGKHRSVVGAPVAPNIATFVSAKTVSLANILVSWRGTRVGPYRFVPRAYVTRTCRRRSREHGSGDQYRRSNSQLGHSTSPFDAKANGAW